MLETFAALFAAHVAADFLTQTRDSVSRKDQFMVLIRHLVVVYALAALFVGFTGWIALLVLTTVHGGMDATKAYLLPADRLWPFLLDQAVHVATLIAVAVALPDLAAGGMWARIHPNLTDDLTVFFLIAAFAIVAVRAGGFAVELLLNPLPDLEPEATAPAPGDEGESAPAGSGVPLAGRLIGQLERGLTFLLMLMGQPVGIAFLIATKSILRFGAATNSRAASEYVIIGTLASVGWAMLSAVALLQILPDATLESLRFTP